MTTKAPSRPATSQARCPRADTHNSSCALPRGHAGPCFCIPLGEGEVVGDAEFQAEVEYQLSVNPVRRNP